MPIYIVKLNKPDRPHIGILRLDGKSYKAGDKVELSEEQAKVVSHALESLEPETVKPTKPEKK